MREETDVSGIFNDDIPDGTYDFTIKKVIRKEVSGKKAYEWILDYGVGTGKVLTWPNQIEPLLKIIGAEKQPDGKYSWDTDIVEGKAFKATIVHEKGKKSDKIYCNIKDFKALEKTDDIPF